MIKTLIRILALAFAVPVSAADNASSFSMGLNRIHASDTTTHQVQIDGNTRLHFTLDADKVAFATELGIAAGVTGVHSINGQAGSLTWTTLAQYGITDAGDMLLSGTQTISGPKSFNDGKLIMKGFSSGTITLHAPDHSGLGPGEASTTVEFPHVAGVAGSVHAVLAEATQAISGIYTFSGLQTFNGGISIDTTGVGVNFSGSGAVNLLSDVTNIGGVLNIGGGASPVNITTTGAVSISGPSSFDVDAGTPVNVNGTLTVGSIVGPLTGNADTATALETGHTIAMTGDVTWTSPAFDGSGNVTAASTVTKINGTSLASLGTGILKNTTGTGVPSIAVAGDFPTLNQNTTGTAAALTTSRNINGTAFNGSADITITAAAGTLTGGTLNSTVTASSLTSLGTLTALNMSGLGTDTITALGGTQSAIGSTTDVAWLLTNTTTAANNAQQISPSIQLRGNGWASGAGQSQAVVYDLGVLPIQGSSTASGSLNVRTSVAGLSFANALQIFLSGTTSSSTTTGTLVVTGGLGVSGNANLQSVIVPGQSFLTGGIVAGIQSLSGAGAVNTTTYTTALTSTGASQALTLANGSTGQIKTIVHDVDGGSMVLTPTTKTGFSTVTFTNAGDTVTLQYFTTRGWMVLSSYGATIAP